MRVLCHHVKNKAVGALIITCTFALPAAAAGTAPVIGEGECLYLLGAPPGAPEAGTEEKVGDAGLIDVCERDAGAEINSSDNLARAWIEKALRDPNRVDSCRTFAWVGHAFELEPSESKLLHGSVAMTAFLRGVLAPKLKSSSFGVSALVRIEVVEISEAGEAVAASIDAFNWGLVREGRQVFEGPIGGRLDLDLRPAHTYQVRLYLEVWSESGGGTLPGSEAGEVDFGRFPGQNRGASYDSIEVCVGTPPRDDEILDAVSGNSDKIDANSAKLDLLLELLADLDDKTCESIRLLLTPEGRRETACCDRPLSFPDGASAPTCGPASPSPAPDTSRSVLPPQSVSRPSPGHR